MQVCNAGVVRAGKPVPLFPLIQAYRMTQNMLHQFQKQFNCSSGRKWWKKAVRGGADKSLARPTSRCRRTESIVSLDRRFCSCAELQVFFCYRDWKEAYQATRAISTTSRRELSSSFFFFVQGKTLKEIHAILTETLGEHAPSYTTVKNWVVQFKRGDFSTCVAPRPGRPKTVTTPEIIDQIYEIILEDRLISAKSISEQLDISREWVGFIIHEDLDMPKCLNADQKR